MAETSLSTSTVPRTGRGVPELVGDTPLVELTRVGADLPDSVHLYGKAEHLNPGGSVKDRPALAMIERGRSSGDLASDKTLIDATSGNTGIAYAMIAASYDIRVKLALPENATEERKKTLRAYGAELVPTDPMEGTDGAQRVVRELVEADPDRYFYPDQYNNPANWHAHYDGTGPEIIRQTEGRISHFVAGLGTTGTFVGTARRLKEYDPDVRCVAFQPATSLHGLEGMKHLDTAMVPGIFDPDLPDEMRFCDTETAYEMVRRLAREEGLLVGPSAGASVATALEVARSLEEGTVVTILCDGGQRYLSEDFWNESA